MSMSKGNRTKGPRKGRPKLQPGERTEPHLVRVRPATWGAMVETAGGPRSVGAMLDERFAQTPTPTPTMRQPI